MRAFLDVKVYNSMTHIKNINVIITFKVYLSEKFANIYIKLKAQKYCGLQ